VGGIRLGIAHRRGAESVARALGLEKARFLVQVRARPAGARRSMRDLEDVASRVVAIALDIPAERLHVARLAGIDERTPAVAIRRRRVPAALPGMLPPGRLDEAIDRVIAVR